MAAAAIAFPRLERPLPVDRNMFDPDILGYNATVHRQEILWMTKVAGSGHPGGSMSAIDALEVMYNHKLAHRPQEPTWNGRDYLIYSKGHCSPALDAELAHQGYIPYGSLPTFRTLGGLPGHADTTTPGVEFPSGSLGKGLSFANGIEHTLRDEIKNPMKRPHVIAIVGDGEMNEGQVWEAVATAAHYKLETILWVDKNGAQNDDFTRRTKDMEPLDMKLDSFGWRTMQINGHNYGEIKHALDWAWVREKGPKAIVANTIKGSGVRFMQKGGAKYHGRCLDDREMEEAMIETNIGKEKFRRRLVNKGIL
ncbi:MAG: transketolase [Candidatus Aenigmatarchaeota archaeon]|nr:MAG: transketolase [Candidatus Aenigmarchaeota archaeon]